MAIREYPFISLTYFGKLYLLHVVGREFLYGVPSQTSVNGWLINMISVGRNCCSMIIIILRKSFSFFFFPLAEQIIYSKLLKI